MTRLAVPELHPACSGPATRSALHARCAELGFPAWRFDPAGVILDGPTLPGPAGDFWRAPPLARLVAPIASSWASVQTLDPTPLLDHCLLLPVPELRRRRRIGFTAVAVASRRFPDSPAFLELCRDAALDPASVAAPMRLLPADERDAARLLHACLAPMALDLAALRESRETIEGFTAQLTDSYETIETLYFIGGSMGSVSRPQEFIRLTCERLLNALTFQWIAVRLDDSPHLPSELRGRVIGAGDVPSALRAPLPLARPVGPRTLRPIVVPMLDADSGLSSPDNPQVICQPLAGAKGAVAHLLGGAKRGPDPEVSSYDTRLFQAAGMYLSAFLENASLYADQEAQFLGTLQALTSSIDAKDPYTCGHSERVSILARDLALACGCDDAAAERVRIAGLVHDVGKIGVPEAVLCKPGKLTDPEFNAIKQHPTIGHRILRDIPALADVLPAVLHHHERWDGRGYPAGLAGEAIPFFARLIAVADTFDAMSSNRAYRPSMPRPMVLEEITRSAGSQLDPSIVPAFRKLDLAAYDALVARGARTQVTLAA